MTLTKQRIARQISESQGISLGEALQRIDVLLAALKRGLAVGDRVLITNFGTFEVVERASRHGINPANGQRIVIPAHRTVVFHPAPRFRREVDRG